VTPYTGVGSNVSPSTSPSISIPQDGVDSESVATVNTFAQKLTDYVAQITSR